MSKLAIIDWGIGGLGVRKAIYDECPDVSVIYFSDTGVTPYGKMGRSELARRLDRIIGYLSGLGVTHVVIGCNAASTAIPDLSPNEVEIEGMIDVAVELAVSHHPASLGVIGGRRTILSAAYRRKLRRYGIEPLQRIAQPLSALIEKGDLESNELQAECQRILRPLRRCSHIMLACTHYSAITGVMSKYVSAETLLLDPASALAKRVEKWDIGGGGQDKFLTTGNPKMMTSSAFAAFGWQIIQPGSVSI